MNIIFQKAKNGQLTASINNLFLHSNYNPEREAERFVQNLNTPFNPKIIIITEPAVSYVIKYLKLKFSQCKFGVIRYCPDFSEFNKNFDFIINYYEHKDDFEDYLFSLLSEEKLMESYFCKWEPSSKIFSEEDKKVWFSIKKSLEKSKTLLITRQYFEKKWLLNSVNFIKYSKHFLEIKEKLNCPVLLISSGPSVLPFLKLIKNNQNNFFIITLSSAISFCIENNIKPDLCLSTDGGYWAGQHLKKLNKFNIPLALSSESYCPKKIIESLKIVPLTYGEGISDNIIKIANLPLMKAKRNGTVSGTGLELALELTTSDIYFAGLDLAAQKGFQHAQPNELEINNRNYDNKLKSKELRLIRSEFSSSSLELYKEWFKNFNCGQRKIFRLMETKDKKNSLNKIKDLDIKSFENIISNYKKIEKTAFYNQVESKIELSQIKKYLEDNFFTDDFKKQLYPLDYVTISHNYAAQEISSRMEKNHNALYNKIINILNK